MYVKAFILYFISAWERQSKKKKGRGGEIGKQNEMGAVNVKSETNW